MYVMCFQHGGNEYGGNEFNLGMFHNAAAAVEIAGILVGVHATVRETHQCRILIRGVDGEYLLKYNVI